MQIKVKVTPNSNNKKVIKVDHPDFDYKIYVNSAPEKGKANYEVINLISEAFKVKKSDVEIINGKTANIKTIKILS